MTARACGACSRESGGMAAWGRPLARGGKARRRRSVIPADPSFPRKRESRNSDENSLSAIIDSSPGARNRGCRRHAPTVFALGGAVPWALLSAGGHSERMRSAAACTAARVRPVTGAFQWSRPVRMSTSAAMVSGLPLTGGAVPNMAVRRMRLKTAIAPASRMQSRQSVSFAFAFARLAGGAGAAPIHAAVFGRAFGAPAMARSPARQSPAFGRYAARTMRAPGGAVGVMLSGERAVAPARRRRRRAGDKGFKCAALVGKRGHRFDMPSLVGGHRFGMPSLVGGHRFGMPSLVGGDRSDMPSLVGGGRALHGSAAVGIGADHGADAVPYADGGNGCGDGGNGGCGGCGGANDGGVNHGVGSVRSYRHSMIFGRRVEGKRMGGTIHDHARSASPSGRDR